MERDTSKNQAIKAEFVRREVGECVSVLVSELAKRAEQFPDYEDDLYQAFSVPDPEGALSDAGIEAYTDEYGADCWRDSDGLTCAGTASEACDFFEVEPYDREIFEHWTVSRYLADQLEARGERILRNFFGLTVWGRGTTGQAILLDGVISDICEGMEILEGQRNEWTV